MLQMSIPSLPPLNVHLFKSHIALMDKVGRETGENLMVVLTKHEISRDAALLLPSIHAFQKSAIILWPNYLNKDPKGCQRK